MTVCPSKASHVVQIIRCLWRRFWISYIFTTAVAGYGQGISVWNFNGDDSWGTSSRWLGGTIGGGAGSVVLFTNDITANRTISLNGNRTVGTLVVGDLSSTQPFTLAPGSPSDSTLTFDMGGGGNSFLNKFQGGVDTISAPIFTNDQINLRITTQTLNLAGSLSGTGSLTKYYDGLLQLTGNNTGSTVGLQVANRGANTTTPEVELGAATGNSIGGDITIGNAGFAGGAGYAVLQLQQGRTNLNQISDGAVLYFNGSNHNWSYLKLMGGSETVGGLIDSNNAAVIENMDDEAVNANAELTLGGDADSYVGGYVRDRASGTGTGTLGISKSGAGTLTLQGTNITYTGPTIVTGGTFAARDTTNFNSSVAVGACATVILERTSGTWNFDDAISGGGDLIKRGSGSVVLQSSGNALSNLQVEAGTLTLSGTGSIFSGGMTLSGNSGLARILNLNGTSTISNGLTATGRYGVAGSGVFISNSNTINGAVNLTAVKMGLSGASGVIGTPTSITLSGNPYVAGEFSIDNTTANTDRVGNTTVFNSNGGIFRMNGGSETLGTLTLNQGELRFITSNSGAVTFNNSLVRNPGSTVSFASTTIGTGTDKVTFTVAPGLANGLIGGWATVGNRFATYGVNGATAAGVTTQNDINTWTSTQNIRVNGGSTTSMGGSRAVNSLVIEDTTGRTVNLGAATRVLTITSGGILSVSGSHTIANGKLTAGPSASGSNVVAPGIYELTTQVNSSQLIINAVIDDNAGNPVSLIKSGIGLLILGGTNTYAGKTYVNAGTLRINGADSRLGAAPPSFVADQLQINGGTLQIWGNTSTSATRGIAIGYSGGSIRTGFGSFTTEVVNINAPINALGVISFAVEGDAVNDVRNTLNVNAAANNFGAGLRTEVGYEGRLNLFGANTIGGIEVNGGVVTFKGSNSISGNVLLNSGSLVLEQANTFAGDSVATTFGDLVLQHSNALGSNPLTVSLGDGGLFVQNGANVLVGDLTSNTGTNTAARIANGSATPSTLTLDMPVSRTFAGVITDGGTGSQSLVKRGPGTFTLTNFQNAFSGVVRVDEGTLEYASANYSYVSSAMGAHADYDPANLVINGGSVMFSLTTPATTDRSFTMGPGANGATLVANGATRTDFVELGVKFDDPLFPYMSPDIAFEGVGSRTLTLAGFNQGNNLFNLRLTDKSVSETSSLLKVSSGYWNIGRANTYMGLTTIMDGSLVPTVNEAFGAAGGLGTNLMGGRLELRGVNYTTPEAVFFEGGELHGSAGNSVWSGDWNLNVPSNVQVDTGASVTELGNLNGNRNLTLTGDGTLTLKGTHSTSGVTNFTGAVSVQQGVLILDYSVNQGSKLSDSNVLALGGAGGGTLILTGGTPSANAGDEIVSGVRLDPGGSKIYRDLSSNAILRMNTVSRNPGSTIYFDQPGIAKVDNSNFNGILGAWAIVRDTDSNGDLDWARNVTGLGDGLVVPASSYVANSWSANANVDVKSSALSIRTVASTANTLRFNEPTTPGDLEVQLQPVSTPANNQIQTGGILVTPKMGSNDAVISGKGALSTGTAQQNPNFLIHQYNTGGNLIVSTSIIDNPNHFSGTTGTFFNGNTQRISGLSSATIARLHVGMGVNGTGIPAGATIVGFYSSTDIQISVPYTGTPGAAVPDLSFDYHNGVEKLGPGTMLLSGSSTYTGATNLAAGTLTATSIGNGGAPSSIGAGSAAPESIVFMGGTLRYAGPSTSVDRGLTLVGSGLVEVARPDSELGLGGVVAGTGTLMKGGGGTLSLSGSALALNSLRVDEGGLRLFMNSADNRFASAVASLTMAGGGLELVGDPGADRLQQFGGRFMIDQGASLIQVTSVYDSDSGLGRNSTLILRMEGQGEGVRRNSGGTIRFIRNVEPSAGAADIKLFVPAGEVSRILPYATYSGSPLEGVNNFAAVESINSSVVAAADLFLHNTGTVFLDPNNWTEFIDPSEGASGSFNGTLSGDRSVNTLRFYTEENATVIVPVGRNLSLTGGAILIGSNVRQGVKQIAGGGTLTGGLAADEGGRDLIVHNYNPVMPFILGVSIADDVVNLVSSGIGTGGSTAAGEIHLTVESGSAWPVLYDLRPGMFVAGPGIAVGTTVVAVDTLSGFNRVTLSQPATSTISSQSYTFTDRSSFVQAGTGTTVLSGNSTYSGTTFVHGGVLRLDSVTAVPGGIGTAGGTSHVVIEGGVLGLGSGDFTRGLGTGVDQIEFKGSGGFAAYGSNRVVNLGGGGSQVSFGQGGFVSNASAFVLGAADATHKVTLVNPLDLDVVNQTVRVDNGPALVEGELEGILSGKAALTKMGAGTLRLTAANTYSEGTRVTDGILIVSNTTGSGTGSGSVIVSAGGGLAGTGVVSGGVTIAGTLAQPGWLMPGEPDAALGMQTLTLSSSLVLDANAIVEFGLAGLTAFKRLIVGTVVSVDPSAKFQVTLEGGYTPADGDTFDLLDWTTGPAIGDLDWVDNLILPSILGLAWDVSQFNTSGQIRAYEVPIPPSVVTPPASQTVDSGSSVTFIVDATGTDPLSYQWQKDGVDIPGATGSSFSLATVQPWHIGYYRVRVTNSAGSVTSDAATLDLVGVNGDLWRGLVAYFDFEGSTEERVFGLARSVTGGVLSTDRLGVASKCYAFSNPGERITVSNAVLPSASMPRTISCWSKANGYASDSKPMVLGAISPSNSGDTFGIMTSLGRWIGWGNGFAYQLSGPNVDSDWHHHVLTFDGNTASYFFDGVRMASAQWAIQTFTSRLCIGSIPEDGSSYWFNGWVDDVRVYNRPLTDAEVQALFMSEVISNVAFAQRADTKMVDIYYDLGGVGTTMAVALEVSSDGGATFAVPVVSVTGDVGSAITPGTGKHIVWDAGTDWPSQSSSQVKVRVTAWDLLGPSAATFARIPGGSYERGNVSGDLDFADAPVQTVELSECYLQTTETTKAQWDTVRTWGVTNGYTDLAVGAGKASNHPVYLINWYDVVKWCNAASEMAGFTPCYYTDAGQTVVYRTGSVDIDNTMVNWAANGYRLPTEAEWEVAARGGMVGKRFPWGDTIQNGPPASGGQANYSGNTGFSYDLGPNGSNSAYATGELPYTSPVGSFAANGYGMYDMAGNVYEWCWDWFGSYISGSNPRGPLTGSNRVLRGGSWTNYGDAQRCAPRGRGTPGGTPSGINSNGFRPARGEVGGPSGVVSATGSLSTLNTDADLASLTISSGVLIPAFDSAATSYTTSVVNGIGSITVTPTAADGTATIQVRVNGGVYETVSSGSTSGALALNVGSNTVEVLVTAQDGVTTRAYTVSVTREKAPQDIVFDAIPDKLTTDSVNLSAMGGGSGNPVTFAVSSGPGVIANNVLTFTTSGSVSITASQAGNANYLAADDVTRTFNVTKATASVTLGSLTQVYDGTPKAASATTTPTGLTVEFTYDGSSTAPTNAGSYAVVGTINDLIYQGSATGTLVIDKAVQVISFATIPDKLTTDSVNLTAAGGDSGNAVTFAVMSGPGAITNNVLTFTTSGSVSITASQAGNANYLAADDVTRTFNVTKATASVTLGSLTQVYDGTPRPATATTTPSGLTVEFTYDGSSTPPTNAGSYAVVGTINDLIYQGSAADTLVIDKAAQVISFATIPDKLTTDSVNLTATGGGSGNPVTFAVASGPGVITNNVLTFTTSGSVSITASQAGNANYLVADDVTRTFNVTKATASVTLGSLTQVYDGTPRPATATTTPSGLTVEFTYDGSSTPPTKAGSYAVVGTINDLIYQGSATDTLVINAPVVITAQPQDKTLNPGQSATFAVVVTGTMPITYQWRKNGQGIDGATSADFTIPAVAEGDEGSFDCVITNVVGSVVSDAATLSVNDPIQITAQPQSLEVGESGSAHFQVVVTGTLPITYQWRRDGTDIAGANADELVIDPAELTDQDTYDVVISNVVGQVVSNAATLKVHRTVAVTGHPTSQIVAAGSPVNLLVSVLGQPPISFQWRKKGAKIPGATSSVYAIANARLQDAGAYSVAMTNPAGTTTSESAQIAVVDLSSARSLSLGTGATARFSITAAGNGLSYRWLKDGNPLPADSRISGGTGKTLTVKSLQLSDDGSYRCEVTAPGGTLAGGENTLVVFDQKPQITEPVAMPDAMIGRAYSFQIPVESGNERSPTSFGASGLPTGLKVDSRTGLISGKPTVTKVDGYVVKLTAANAKGKSSLTTSLTVIPLPEGTPGSYVGAVKRDGTSTTSIGGRINFSVATSGAFSGKLILGAKTHAFKGTLAADLGVDPTGSATVARKNESPVQIEFTIDPDAAAVNGTVDDGNVEEFTLTGWRNVWHATRNPVLTRAGRHVYGLDLAAGLVGDDSVPQGTGFGAISVAKGGTASLSGRLADGSVTTTSAPLGPNGEVLAFASLYAGTGEVIGLVTIADDSTHTLGGSVSWLKNPQTKASERTYKAGFGPLTLGVRGGLYVPPTSGQIVLGLNDEPDNAQVRFLEAGIGSASIHPDTIFRVTNRNAVQLPPSGSINNPAKLTLSLSAQTGAFKGTFKLSDVPAGATKAVNRTVTYQGMVVPSNGGQDRGYGFFMLPQLPDAMASPPTTTSTSPILSGQVVLETVQ